MATLSTAEVREAALRAVQFVIPELVASNHKGSCGRIAIVGGSVDYCGAPYFAAMAALRCGADLAYVLCPPDAALAIKAFSPDICVRPLITANAQDLQMAAAVVSVCHAVVIGPGIGDRDPDVMAVALPHIVAQAVSSNIPIVVDTNIMSQRFMREAFTTHRPSRLILTPNAREVSVLCNVVSHGAITVGQEGGDDLKALHAIANSLNATVVVKGEADLIVDPTLEGGGTYAISVLQEGTLPCYRRAAGQGDIVSGAVGCFAMWAHLATIHKNEDADFSVIGMPLSSAALALALLTVRTAAQMAVDEHGRGMVASDVLKYITRAVERIEELYDSLVEMSLSQQQQRHASSLSLE